MAMTLGGAIDRRAFLKTSLAAGIAVSVRPLAACGAGTGVRCASGRRRHRVAADSGDGRTPHRRPAQGHRRQALRRRFPRRGHAGLAARYRARHAAQDPRRDPHLRGDRPRRARPGADARSCRARRRSRRCRDHRAGLLRRRSPLPCRQDAALSRPAGRASDLERFRPFRARQAGDPALRAACSASARKPARSPSNLTRPRASCALPARPRIAEDVYSPMLAGWTFPVLYQKDDRPDWAVPSATGSDASRASYYGDQIRAEIGAAAPDRLVLDRSFQTQSIDQVFLEPEAGLAWYDSGARKLELVIGVQSPHQAAASVAMLVSEECRRPGGRHDRRPLRLCRRRLRRQGPHHLSALRRAGRPVLAATARCVSPMIASTSSSSASSAMPSPCGAGWRSTAASGRITAFAADQDLDGGGLANLSAAVAFVGATASIGMYDVPKVDVTTVARHSRAVTAGSMRGFGALQTMTALEVMIDEAAASLGRDPVAFRKANLLKTGGKTMVGNVVSGALRSGEVLDRLASKPIWSGTRGREGPPCRRGIRTRPMASASPASARCSAAAPTRPSPWSRSIPPAASALTSQAVEIGTGDRDRARGARGRQARHRRRRGEARRARRLGRARAGRRRTIRSPSPASSRMQRRRIRAGFPTSPRTPPHRSRLMSTPRSPPRRRTSSCASASGRRRWRSGRPGSSAARPPASSSASRTSVSSTAA